MLAPPSKRAAMDAVLEALIVDWVDVETWRVGDLGKSGSREFARVVSHAGGFCEALLTVALRKGVWFGVAGLLGVGFSGELVGVRGRAVDGEPAGDCPSVLGRRKGDVRGLLKERGDGL